MTDEQEIFVCDSCGRDFSVDMGEAPVRKEFCPSCLSDSPYLLEDPDNGYEETPQSIPEEKEAPF